jgi:hypothetical protein
VAQALLHHLKIEAGEMETRDYPDLAISGEEGGS